MPKLLIKSREPLDAAWHISQVTLETESDLNLFTSRITNTAELSLGGLPLVKNGVIMTEYYNGKQEFMHALGITPWVS